MHVNIIVKFLTLNSTLVKLVSLLHFFAVASHPHLPPPHLLHPNFSDMIWKQQRYATVPTHLLGNQQAGHTAEDLERERAMFQERHTHNERMIR